MEKEDLNKIMNRWAEIISFTGVLSGYCKNNMNVKEICTMQTVLDYILEENGKLYNCMEHFIMKNIS